MAIGPNQGIMALPENQAMQAPQLSLSDSYDAMQQGLMQARPDAYLEMQEALAEIRPELEELTDEQLALLIQALQDLYNDPQNYAAKVQELVKNRFIESAEELPPEYNEEFIATLLMVLVDIQRSRQGMATPMPQMEGGMPAGMVPPPQQFARGGIADAARIVASQGRNGDTMLAHITPEEARFLRARGGSGTINPQTGLPEFWPLLSRKRGIGKAITKALSSPLGRIIGTIALGMVLGPAVGSIMSGFSGAAVAATTSALSSGLVTAAAGGDLKASLTAAATGFLTASGGPVSNYIGKYTGQFLSNPVVREAANAAIIGTGIGVATGQNLKDAVKSGLTEGVIAGGMAYLSGAPKVDADNAAMNAAADATTNGPKLDPLDAADDTQAYIDKYGKTYEQRSGAAAMGQRVNNLNDAINSDSLKPYDLYMVDGEASQYLGKDPNTGAGIFEGKVTGKRTSVDVSPNAVPKSFGLDTKPKAVVGSGVDLAQAASRGASSGVSVPSSGAGLNYEPIAGVDFEPIAGVDFKYEGPGGAAPAKGATGPYQQPTIGESFGQMGSGAKKFLTGDFSEGASQFYKGAENLFSPGPSAEQRTAMIDDFMAKNPKASVTDALKYVDEVSPNMMRSYGPTVATGIGALALAGGFNPEDPPDNPMKDKLYGTPGLDLINANPSQYLIQGLPGVSYGPQGNIMGSQQYQSPYTMQNIQVPTMYADGGIAALMQGGYPRKVGQISGPGTEKSDSIPAMLSDGEFVMTARAVRGAGGGSRREGAKRMYALMHQLERNAARG